MLKRYFLSIGNKFRKTKNISTIDFEKYFTAMREISKKAPIDNFLSEYPTPITIETFDKKIHALRIELPNDEPLNLQSIELYEDKHTKLHTKDLPQVWLSSYYDNTADRIKNNDVFDSESGYEWTIHTKPYAKSWALIIFNKPVKIHKIVIRNRKRWTERSKGMKVFIAEQYGPWKLVHKVSKLKKFETLSREVFEDFKLNSVIHGIDFHKFVEHIIKKQDWQAERAINELPDDLKEVCVYNTNKHLLSPEKLEWGSHGVAKSFKFWTLEEKKRYILFFK